MKMNLKKMGRQWYVRVAILISILAYALIAPTQYNPKSEFTKKYGFDDTTGEYSQRMSDSSVVGNITLRISQSIGIHFIPLLLGFVFFFFRIFGEYYPKWFIYLLFVGLAFTWYIILTSQNYNL